MERRAVPAFSLRSRVMAEALVVLSRATTCSGPSRAANCRRSTGSVARRSRWTEPLGCQAACVQHLWTPSPR